MSSGFITPHRIGLGRAMYESAEPFRKITVHGIWFISTVKRLVAAIYAERAFDRLPILAGVLEDASCDNTDFLRHHARVVDLLRENA